ncbi:Uncharacterised protein [Mycobacteroides abscessus subsp. massiliense]|nr:Uncharacterised protein [Mycobacteroides abscessus subsp. massiliense]
MKAWGHYTEEPIAPARQRKHSHESATCEIQSHLLYTKVNRQVDVSEKSLLRVRFAAKLLTGKTPDCAARSVRADEPTSGNSASTHGSHNVRTHPVGHFSDILYRTAP